MKERDPEGIECPDCGEHLGEPVDTTYSNTGRDIRPVDPCHTGDIYFCEKCECKWIHDFISEKIYVWRG